MRPLLPLLMGVALVLPIGTMPAPVAAQDACAPPSAAPEPTPNAPLLMPEQARLDFAPFLQKNNFSFYLYAPKADPFLRKKWREAWSGEYKAKLAG